MMETTILVLISAIIIILIILILSVVIYMKVRSYLNKRIENDKIMIKSHLEALRNKPNE